MTANVAHKVLKVLRVHKANRVNVVRMDVTVLMVVMVNVDLKVKEALKANVVMMGVMV